MLQPTAAAWREGQACAPVRRAGALSGSTRWRMRGENTDRRTATERNAVSARGSEAGRVTDMIYAVQLVAV